jgi:predicted Zn finger-like uncharacterized protein
MIVKCEQCQTRFKIPDEKVTDKGVKVRCTKCSHTFRVTRESAVDAVGTPAPVPSLPAPGSPGGGFDPFERFGTAPEPKGPTTRPGFVPEAVEASRQPAPPPAPMPPAPWNFTDSGMSEEIHHEATRVMPLPVPAEARPPVPSLPPVGFDFDAPLAAPAPARGATPAPGQGFAPRGSTPAPGQGFAPRGSTPAPGQGFAPRGGTPTPGQGLAPRGNTPVPGQGVSGPRPSFMPSAEPAVPLPSVAPVVSPMAKGPAAPGAPKRPPSGSIARPSALGPSPGAPQGATKPPAKSTAAAAVPAAGDLFSEFFTPGAAGAPLPDLPPPSMSSIPGDARSVPLPAPSAPQTPAYAVPFGGGDAAAFGSVDMDLSEAPPDLGGPPPEFDAAPDFDAPAPPPAAPPQPPPRPLAPPAPAPLASKPRGGPAAPASRMAPPAMAPPAMAPPAYAPPSTPVPMPASSVGSMDFGDEDPFSPGNVGLSAPAPAFDPAPPAQDFAPVPMPAPEPMGAPFPFADEDPFAAATAPMAAAAPPPMPAPQAPAGFGDDFAPPGPMDFGMLGDEQMPPEESTRVVPPPPGARQDPFAAPEPAGGMPDPFASPGGGMADPFAAQDQQGGMADPFAAQEQQGGMADPFAAQEQQGGMEDPFAAQAQQGGMEDPFAAQAQQGGMPDPFANAEPAFSATATGRHMLGSGDASEGYLTQTDTSHRVISPTDTGRSLLDLPAPDTGMEASGEDLGQGPPARELIDVPVPPEAPPSKPPPTLASPAIARPAGRPADMGIPERRKLTTAQAVTGQVAYLTIAAGLLLAMAAVGGVYMKQGHVDASALSPGELVKLVTPSDFVARNVSNGLYDTRGGNAVFYVRGEVENRSSKPARVKVGAALYDGAQRVKSVEGLAGGVPTPEELHAVNTSEAAEQLRTKLDSAATEIAPGAKAPFTLVFQEFPQQLSDFRLRVTMEPAAEETARP